MKLKKGMIIKKGDILSEIWKLRFKKKNSSKFFSLLLKSGHIEIKGNRIVKVKKDIWF